MHSRHRSPRRPVVSLALVAAAAAGLGCATLTGAGPAPAPATGAAPRHVRVLAVNDFHGQLEAEQGAAADRARGAAALVGALRAAQASAPGGTLFVSAGDLVGASPAISGLLQDEPTIDVVGGLGNASCGPVPVERREELAALAGDPRCDVVATCGNHELDEGFEELLRLWHGGDRPGDRYPQGPWRGARFPLVAANVADRRTGAPALPPFVVREVGGVRIGVIGVVTHEVPTLVNPVRVAGLTFGDEAAAVNAAARALAAQGVRAIVVLLHDGDEAPPYEGATRADARVPERIARLVARLDPEVDALVTAHAHTFTNAVAPNAGGRPVLVTQAFSRGRAFAQLDLTVDPATGDVVERTAQVVRIGDDRPADPTAAAVVARARAVIGPWLDGVVATAAAPIPLAGAAQPAGESPLGDLVADAFREAARADVALVQPGGIRAELGAGPVTREAVHAVLPFGDPLVVLELTGAELLDVLEAQWRGGERPRLHAVSGLRYAWGAPDGAGRHVRRVEVAGRLLEPARRYAVTVTEYLADAGAGYGFPPGPHARRSTEVRDLDALAGFLASRPQPVQGRVDGRIVHEE